MAYPGCAPGRVSPEAPKTSVSAVPPIGHVKKFGPPLRYLKGLNVEPLRVAEAGSSFIAIRTY